MAHIWYEGTSHGYTSPGTMVKVICKGQGQISGSCSQKMGVGGTSVSQTHLIVYCSKRVNKCCIIPYKKIVGGPNSKRCWLPQFSPFPMFSKDFFLRLYIFSSSSS